MNGYRETAFLFPSRAFDLLGIVTLPACRPGASPHGAEVAAEAPDAPAASLGVLIVVGGPQYRVGSHRQFVLLARALARRGFAVMRFDCSGMGDSGGAEQAFTDRDDDIRAAIDAFVQQVPSVRAVALWGLCDAASAALLYAPRDPRVAHLVILNPWVRSAAGLARTHLKHYYTSRLADRAFWTDLLRGRVGVLRALKGLVATVVAARSRSRRSFDAEADARDDVEAKRAATGVGAGPADDSADFATRMAHGWRRFGGDILLIRSGDDLTAREFTDHAGADAAWAGLVDEARVARCDLPDADHTFSRAHWRDRVAELSGDWLLQRADARPARRLPNLPQAGRRTREPA